MPKLPTTPAGDTKAAAIPAPETTPEIDAKIQKWLELTEWMAKAKAQESVLRRELVSFFVPTPKEGNNLRQGNGFSVRVSHKITRNLDEAALQAVMPQLPEEYQVVGKLIKYTPDFILAEYRAMSAEHRKIFEQALVIKDGSPTLEIITQSKP